MPLANPIDPTLLTAGVDKDLDDAVADLDKAIKELTIDHLANCETLTAAELLDLPEERITEGEWTDEDIFNQVKVNNHEKNGEHVTELDDPEPEDSRLSLMTKTQVIQAIKKLCQFLNTFPEPEYRHADIYLRQVNQKLQQEINSALVQTNLSHFFASSS